ncbi:MAG TPA: ABC transporter permease [Gemmatimonadales bacterium]|nr:ABC transporter permease [Gemmatimonadales bacterium]
MRKVLAVIRREFEVRVRTKAFVITTVLGPVIMACLIFLPGYWASKSTSTRSIIVVDAAAGGFGDRVVGALSASTFGDGAKQRPRYQVAHLQPGERSKPVFDSLIGVIGRSQGPADAPDGILVLTDTSLSSGEIDYFGSNVGSIADMIALEGILRPVIQTERLIRENVDTSVVRRATAKIDIRSSKVSEGKITGASGISSFWMAYIMTFILYFSLLIYGMQVMSSVLEEKTSRVMEILASSLTPFQLMLGKVLGVGSVGLFQLGIWSATSLYLTSNLVSILRMFGQSSDVAASITVPAISPGLLAVFLTFFLLGFFLYAALYAAVGSMCTTQQDIQQAQQPVTLSILAGFMCMFPVLNDPSGSLARTLSLIPFVAPFVTPLRYSISPLPLGQLVLSIGCTLAGIVAIIWIASRIYRVGILAYGKRPTFKELWNWIRTA